MPKIKSEFPSGFLWGASTSAHQVEGGTYNQWDRWEMKNAERLAGEAEQALSHWLPNWNRIKPQAQNIQNYISGRTCDHWNRYEEDVRLAKSLGMNAYRFSIEWSRVEPQEGQFSREAIKHYQQMIDSLRKHDIQPFVTLWHWTVPLWFEDGGGWKNSNAPDQFASFVSYVGKNLKGVQFWITLNEPNVYIYFSLLKAAWPPQNRSFRAAQKARRNLARGHRLAYKILKSFSDEFQVGLSENLAWFELGDNSPTTYVNKLVNERLSHYFFRHNISKMDFIGLNHYFHNRLKGWKQNQNANKKLSDLGWELYPEGLYHAAQTASAYKKPIYITEHGLADAEDKNRKWFLTESLRELSRAISEGADVRGYMHWSLLDNFEWAYGFWPRFGLIEVDYKTLKRTVRPSAKEYAQIIQQNGVK